MQITPRIALSSVREFDNRFDWVVGQLEVLGRLQASGKVKNPTGLFLSVVQRKTVLKEQYAARNK